MNWMGGARNRVKFQGERKTQKEFFDRKRLTARAALCRGQWAKRNGLSQDLAALHTVSRAHSQTQGNGNQQPIKPVDLEKFQSCTRSIQEVDIGPASPVHAPSKLFLMDTSNSTNSSLPSIKQSKLDFPKSSKPSSRRSANSSQSANTSSSSTISPAEDSFRKNSTLPMQESKSGLWNTSTPMFPLPHPDVTPQKSMPLKPGLDLQLSDRVVKSKKTLRQSVFNPFVAEDFQVTPLKNYTTQPSQSTDVCSLDTTTKGQSKSLSRAFNTELEQTKPSPESPEFTKYFTSTPFKHSREHKRGSRPREFSFSSTMVSPIEKHVSPRIEMSSYIEREQDDFTYHPRPIPTSDRDMQGKDLKLSNTSTHAIETPTKYRFGSSNTASKSQVQSFTTDNTPVFVYDTETVVSDLKIDGKSTLLNKKRLHTKKDEKIPSQDVIKPVINITCTTDIDTSSDHITRYDSDVSSFSPDKTLHLKNISSSRENATETTSSLLFFKQRSMMTETPEFNSRNTQQNNIRNELKESGCENTHSNKNESSRPRAMLKPLSFDYDSDFHYKPFKKRKHSMEAAEGVMTMYPSYKKPKDDIVLEETPTVRPINQKFTQDQARRTSGGSISVVASPTTADDFPSSLQATLISTRVHGLSRDLEAKLTVPAPISSTGASSIQSPIPEECATRGPRMEYLPTEKKMDDVLREMSQLEEGDTVEADHHGDDEIPGPAAHPTGDPSTEATEADCYLESVEKLWVDVNKDTSEVRLQVPTAGLSCTASSQGEVTGAAKPGVSPDKPVDVGSAVEPSEVQYIVMDTEAPGMEGDTGSVLNDEAGKVIDEAQQYVIDNKTANRISNSTGDVSYHEFSNSCEIRSAQNGKPVVLDGERNEDSEQTLPLVGQGKLQYSGTQDTGQINITCSGAENILTTKYRRDDECNGSSDAGKRDLESSESIYFKNQLSTSECLKNHKIATNNTVHHFVPDSKFVIHGFKLGRKQHECLPTGNTTMISQKVQDPEVSSGRSTSVQTEIKQFVDIASSPFVDLLSLPHDKLITRSIGTQCSIVQKCNKSNIPRLVHLAGTLLQVKPIAATKLIGFCSLDESIPSTVETQGKHKVIPSKIGSQETETQPQCGDKNISTESDTSEVKHDRAIL